MNDKIKLSRSHISLPNNWEIKNQSQYETSQYLMEQEALGFNPAYLVTFHYYHPDENKSQDNLLKDGRTTFKGNLWKESPKDKFIRNRRLDVDYLIEDTREIRNVILKELYGIKRLHFTFMKEERVILNFILTFFFQEKI